MFSTSNPLVKRHEQLSSEHSIYILHSTYRVSQKKWYFVEKRP